MARGRMIDKRIGMSKKLGKAHDKSRTLYFMIYPHLDREGRIKFEDIEDLKDEIMPKFKDWTLKHIAESLNELADVGLIILYPNNKEIAMQFIRFEDFQYGLRKDREAASVVPLPPESSGAFRINLEKSPLSISISLINIKEGRKEIKETTNKHSTKEIIDYFNETAGQKRSCDCKETNKMIIGRFNEGRAFEDFVHVIDTKTSQWLHDKKMRKYLRPSTLFREGNFEDYLNEPYESPRKIEPGESDRKLTPKEDEFLSARKIKEATLIEKYKSEMEKAKRDKDIEKIEKIENKIKEELAEFSKQYHEKGGRE